MRKVFSHKGWYTRDHYIHRDEPGLIQAITFRLADSLPLHQLYASGVKRDPDADRERIQGWLDRGWGACLLSNTRAATIVEDVLLHDDGQRYVLLAWVVMPNHVHVLIEATEGGSLPEIVQGWKGVSARRVNAALGRQGQLWRSGYYDRYMRDLDHFEQSVLYVHNNPVKAGLVEDGRDWRFGSARLVESLRSTYHTPTVTLPLGRTR